MSRGPLISLTQRPASSDVLGQRHHYVRRRRKMELSPRKRHLDSCLLLLIDDTVRAAGAAASTIRCLTRHPTTTTTSSGDLPSLRQQLLHCAGWSWRGKEKSVHQRQKEAGNDEVLPALLLLAFTPPPAPPPATPPAPAPAGPRCC